MSSKLGKKIGEGGCSEIFEWEGSSKLIKLAKPNTNYAAMRREYENNLIAWDIGLPVAQVYQFLEVNDRPGIVLERIYGETLMERFVKEAMNQQQLKMGFHGQDFRITARLLSEIHQKSNIQMPSIQKEKMKESIHGVNYLTSIEKKEIITILDSLPTKQLLCHGDPNPGNIIIRDDGQAVVIDWMNASIGNPEADLAEFIIMIKYAILPPFFSNNIVEYFDSIRESIIDLFMDEYTQLTGIKYSDVVPWIVPVAARKLSADAITEEEKSLLIQEVRRNLNESC